VICHEGYPLFNHIQLCFTTLECGFLSGGHTSAALFIFDTGSLLWQNL